LLDITAKVGIENMFSRKLWNSNLQDTNNYYLVLGSVHYGIRVSNFQADRKTKKLMTLDRWKSDSNGVLG
jgi:hypothetical protein